MGLACLRKRWFGWHFWRLAYRLRGQARSHRGYLVSLFFEPGANLNVGAGLNCESGGSAGIFGDWHTAFAGEPAPTGDTWWACFLSQAQIQMWELACLRRRWFGWHFWRLVYRLRRQARSHRGYLVSLFFEPGANLNVGAGLPAKGWVSWHFWRLARRYRNQAKYQIF